MYPAGELKRLERRKALICWRAAAHRRQCVRAGAEIAQPLEWLDRAWATWRRIAPLAKVVGVPLGLMLARKIFRRLGKVAALARFVPMIFQTVRMVSGRQKVSASSR